MLDAAHGASVGTGSCVQRVDVACCESKITRIVVAGGERRRTVVVAIRADVRQGSRLAVADARSRSLDSNRWDECRGWPSGKIRSRRMDNWRRRWSVPAFGFRRSGAEAASGLLNLPDLAGRGRDLCHSGPEVVLSLGPTLQDTQRAPLGMPFVFRETDSRNTISSLQRRIP